MEKMVVSTEETKEAIRALIVISGFLAERLKDGFGVDDVVAAYSKMTSDDVFRTKVLEGFKNWDKIPGELQNLDATAITMLGIELAPDFIDLLKKLTAKEV